MVRLLTSASINLLCNYSIGFVFLDASSVSFLGNVAYSLGSAAVVGFMFWTYLSNRLANQDNVINELRQRVLALEKDKMEYLIKNDYRTDKKDFDEDIEKLETRLEKKIDNVNSKVDQIQKDVSNMPNTISKIIKNNQ